MPVGLDSMAVRRPIPVEKALARDTLLVYGMNGDVLPPDHGFPVRLLVPGWIGVANVKWVGSIEVSETPLESQWNTTSYRMFGPDYPDAPLLTTQVVKSALELPFPATLRPGRRWLTGRSWSGEGRITKVEVSFDDSRRWHHAQLGRDNATQAWRQWSIPWNAHPGEHTIRVRARDDRGNVQPTSVPFNEQGYLFGAVVAHPVSVG
ncbi:MAG TPA: molybdopterin-dependent oxidoreductase, partial [Nocardioides sp.]|nr:molybdopterin-dependent oxidoreductase [Nocardioides sp.]